MQRALLLLSLLVAPPAFSQEPEVVMPSVVYEAPVVYPPEALAEQREAAVRMEIELSDSGTVLAAVVVDSPSEAFSEAALEAIRSYRFTPATYGGEPVGVTITYVLTFDVEVVPQPSIEGIVRKAGVRTPLAGVSLELVGPDGAVAYARSGPDGTFTAYDLAPGDWVVRVVNVTLSSDDATAEVSSDTVVSVTLYALEDRPWETEEGVTEIVVETRAEAAEVSERRVTTVEAMALPGSNGDIIKAVLNFPGIARPPLGIGQLIVRGTGPNDSRFFVDGAPVPQVFHFGGLSTVLNGDALEDIRFLPGNYSVRYGDALGGVVDIVPSTRVPERSRGYISVDVYQAAAFIEQRLSKKTWLTLSGRRSYADAVLGPVLSSFGGGGQFRAPRYYDAQLRIAHRTDQGGLFDAWVVFSDDQFRLLGMESEGVRFGLSTTFLTASMGWRAPLGGGWLNESRVTVGPDRNAFTFDDSESKAEAITVSFRQEVRKEVPDDGIFGWRFGMDLRSEAFRFELGLPGFTEVDKGSGWRSRPALYAENTLRLGRSTLVSGVRASAMSIPGIHSSWAVDPRAILSVRATDTTTLVGTVGRYSQFPQNREVLPVSRGVTELTPQWSLQSSIGLRQQLPFNLSLEVTGYYNELFDLVVGHEDRFEFTSGPPTPLPEDVGDYANDGRGRVFGGEALLRLDGERAAAWLSATVSRSTRRGRPDQEFKLFPFDQSFTINALGTYKLPKRWTIGARGRVSSGNPYFPVVNRVQSFPSHAFVPVFAADPSRTRAWWSVDLRFDKEWVFRKWALTFYLDIQGITDPNNTELIAYSYDYSEVQPIRSTPPLPAFGLKGAW